MTRLIGNDEKRYGWFVELYNQWPAIIKPTGHNWQDWCFTAFKIAGENSPYKRSWEVELALLGFTIIATYVHRDTDAPTPQHGAVDAS